MGIFNKIRFRTKKKEEKLNRYRVKYTNQKGKRISRVVRATTIDNAFLKTQLKFKGENVKINRLKRK